MSDTHDRLEAVEKAVKFFNEAGVEQVLHAGDLVSPFVAPKFADLEAELHYVWGNNEGDQGHTRTKFSEIGVEPLGDFAVIELEDRKIALLHGTNEDFVQALAKSGDFDAVVRGHTHEAGIQEDPLVINPGEVCGYLSGRQTVALLDLEVLKTKIVELQD
ncbi:phosphodiesterase [candidate division MSBL1 archaeon SCGC-AAA833F18]|uniref:Phosphoesterase n=4 Tax=candidate division MSBL1 TaxID=215777 RepID=A0A133UYN4_9EURY|nr:phosphodiesterase [candidate division MSBL1 archaeon SCGC-AAA261C02]KXB04104.1 phosphodiesterase [candidate division MSBL1 archaeon SCGC-AAA261G05]KXB09416.1 phosphodiesterase [candidate division MSBL1 archaeon SCGC-AAA833K04]KXB09702.1 phosphodiesterase [candidate division MSBL1 archaeon SCGC-AAA833F18]